AEDGRIEARNTDSYGLRSSLEESLGKSALRGATVALFGAGGAARAAILALEALGAGRIMILNRDRSRADVMASALRPRMNARLSVLADADWAEAAGQIRVLINATSGGMRGSTPLAFPLEPLPPDAVVCDLVYNPVETELLKDARRRGHRTIDG